MEREPQHLELVSRTNKRRRVDEEKSTENNIASVVLPTIQYVTFWLPVHPELKHHGWNSLARTAKNPHNPTSPNNYMLSIMLLEQLEKRFGYIDLLRWLLRVSFWNLGLDGVDAFPPEDFQSQRWYRNTDLFVWSQQSAKQRLAPFQRQIPQLALEKSQHHPKRMTVSSSAKIKKLLAFFDARLNIDWAITPLKTQDNAAALLFMFLQKAYKEERQALDQQSQERAQRASARAIEREEAYKAILEELRRLEAPVIDLVQDLEAAGKDDLIASLIPGKTTAVEASPSHYSQLDIERKVLFCRVHPLFRNLNIPDEQIQAVVQKIEHPAFISSVLPPQPFSYFNIHLRK
jgi:hypothetical protein